MLNLFEPTPLSSSCLDSWDTFSTAFREHFHPVTIEEYDTFQPYFTSWERSGRMPRYFQSISALMETGVYWWAVINDCLVIIKRRCIHNNPIFYLILPPINRFNDELLESTLIEKFRRLNVSTKLTTQDVDRLPQMQHYALRPDPWPEFVYETSELASVSGKRWKTERAQVNQIKGRVVSGELRLLTNDQISSRSKAAMETTVENWERIRDLRGQAKLLKQLFTIMRSQPDRIRLRALFEGSTCICYSATERVSDRYWNIVAGIRNYEHTGKVNDPNMFLQHIDSDELRRSSVVTHFNRGSSAPKGGLYDQKMKLRPCAVMTINTLETPRPLTKTEWEMTKRS